MKNPPAKQPSINSSTRNKQTKNIPATKKPATNSVIKNNQLWTSLYLPNLQLESINPEQSAPIAITERVKNQQQIISFTSAAAAFGITQSMALNSAYALCPALTIVEYNEEQQATLLQQLGEWAMQFSSIVCLHPPHHLLIEIAGSKRLFESYKTLITLISQELTTLGFNAQIGIAPTPLAANLLACASSNTAVIQQERLQQHLKDLPIALLDIDTQITDGLRQSGIHNIGGLFNISPASLTRRFGPAFVKYLDCLLGKHPYPVTPIRSSELFARTLDLPIEVDNTNALQFATQRMTNELSIFLITRDCGVNSFSFTLRHERQQDTCLQLRFLQASSQPAHLHQVLTERLSQTVLPAPVCGLAMLANTFSPIDRDGADFFHKSQRQQKSLGEVIDKLSGRLGTEALHMLLTAEDHRPEKAWSKSFPNAPVSHKPTTHNISEHEFHWPQRPVWILNTPKITTQQLHRASSIERIETGWWDNTDVRRDYFIAHDNHGTRYWAFTLRDGSDELYIHGLFA